MNYFRYFVGLLLVLNTIAYNTTDMVNITGTTNITTNITTVPLRSTARPAITSSASRINPYFNNLLSY